MRNLQRIIHLACLWISKATDAQRRTSFRFENGFHRGKFDGLGIREEASIKITADNLQRCGDNAHRQRQQQPFAVVVTPPTTQHCHCIDRRNTKARRNIAGQEHVDRLVRRTGIQHRLEGINARYLTVLKDKTGRGIHPGVCADNEPCRGQPTDPDGKGTEPVGTRREAIPPIEVETKENGLQEKGKAL